MSILDSPDVQRNLKLAERINAEARNDPSSPYAGKFIAILDGEILIVADTLREAFERLEQTGAETSRMLCFEAGEDWGRTEYIWGPL